MRPIRSTILAALTAAIAIAPLASAEAHKRHRDRDIAAAIALGLFAAGVIAHSHKRHRYVYRHGRNCYGLPKRQYYACKNGYYGGHTYYPRHHGHKYYRYGVPDRVINGR